jgi:thymidylate synthase
MNSTDLEYQRILKLVLEKGKIKTNRTKTPTLGVFGVQARFDLSEGFPLLTTKKMAAKSIIHELLWFLKGDTNIKYLVDNDVHIWDADCYRNYKNFKGDKPTWVGFDSDGIERESIYDKEDFIDEIKNNIGFANKWGELGEGVYGKMWRAYPYSKPVKYAYDNGLDEPKEFYKHELNHVDQISKAINTLKTDPDSRRIIVNAWHPYWVDHCTLPPCHVLFQFNTEELTTKERLKIHETRWVENSEDWVQAKKNRELLNSYPCSDETWNRFFDKCEIPKQRLNVLLYQRSCDLFLGVPFNISSYSLLLSMVAQVVNMMPGEFIHTYGDLHLYQNHIAQAEEQITRTPYDLPKLWLNPEIKDIFNFKFEDIKIENYNSHPAIKGEVSVG